MNITSAFYCLSTLTNKYTIISQIITLLHVSTLAYHPQYLAKSHKYFKCSCWWYNLQLRCFTQVWCKFWYYSRWNLNLWNNCTFR